MKIRLLALSAVATFMLSCGGGSTPEAVTESFHKALAEGDFDKAAGMCTEEGKKNVDSQKQMAGMANMAGEEKKEVKIAEVKCDTKEDKSTCTCKEEGGNTVTYELVKKDNKWLVDYKKMMGGMEEGMETEPIEPEPMIEEDTTAAPVE